MLKPFKISEQDPKEVGNFAKNLKNIWPRTKPEIYTAKKHQKGDLVEYLQSQISNTDIAAA